MAGLGWWAGWRSVWHALAVENAPWFGLCVGGQVLAYGGYALALRGVARVDDGVNLGFPVALGVVCVGFSPIFCANAAGGFSVDLVTLRETGMSRARAFERVLALGVLEYVVLAPAVAVCGLLLFLHVGGEAAADLTLPWLAVVPSGVVAAWLSSPGRRGRFQRYHKDAGRIRRGLAHATVALTIVRNLIVDSRQRGLALVGSGLYWLGDMVTLWAALRVFDVRLSAAVLVLAYGTGWALTRRSLPFGGPGAVEVLLAYVLTWFHVRFGSAAAGVVAYRLFNFWLALLPAALVVPYAEQVQRRLDRLAADAG